VRPFLVVGRQGQVATDLVAASQRAGVSLVALGRPDLDLADPDSIARALDRTEAAAVINAAAYTAVDRAESERNLAFAVNRDGPASLAQRCARARVPLIHLSTDQVFDGHKQGGYVETDPPNPLCAYGRSKLAGETAVAEAHDDHLIVRVSWVFGPSGDNFVTKLLGWARTRDTLTVVCDQRGRPTYAPVLADALIVLALRMTGQRPSFSHGEKVATEQPGERSAVSGESSPLALSLRSDPLPMGEGERTPCPRGLLHLAGASVMTRDAQGRAVMAASATRGGPSARIEPVPTHAFPTPAARPLNAELDSTLAAERYGIRLGRFEDDLAETLDRLLGPPLEASA
jgi:dTDP-4-dehydrorhamnose reductase